MFSQNAQDTMFLPRSALDAMTELMVYADNDLTTFRVVRKLSDKRALVIKVFSQQGYNSTVGSAKVWNTEDFTLEKTVSHWRTNNFLGYMSTLGPNLAYSLYREYERGLELLVGIN